MKLLIAAICAATSSPVETTLNLLELGRDVGLRRIGFRGLDHLDAPGVGDIAVGERDPIRTFLGGKLEELGLVRPGREAVRVGRGAGDDLGSGGVGGRGERASGGHPCESGKYDKANRLHGSSSLNVCFSRRRHGRRSRSVGYKRYRRRNPNWESRLARRRQTCLSRSVRAGMSL